MTNIVRYPRQELFVNLIKHIYKYYTIVPACLVCQVLALSLCLTAALTLLIPVAAKTGGADGTPIFLIIIRWTAKTTFKNFANMTSS
jgi:hypothetical protein